MQERKWFVIYTIPRWEKKVARLLTEAGIENYCPLNKVTKSWSDRRKVIQEPLFKGYVFVRLCESEKGMVKSIKGAINFLHWLGKPAIVKDGDIEVIQKFLRDHQDISVSEYVIEKDSKVLISNGLLMNYQGVVEEVLGSRVRIKIQSMGIELSALIEKKNLQPTD